MSRRNGIIRVRIDEEVREMWFCRGEDPIPKAVKNSVEEECFHKRGGSAGKEEEKSDSTQ